MADTKLSGLTALTTFTNDDLFLATNDPGGSPLSQYIAGSHLATVWTAWTPTMTGMSESGSPIYGGYYMLIHDKLLIATCTFSHNGGTYESTSGTTYINNLPFTVVVGGGVIVRANAPDTAGVVYVGGTTVYLPTWAAASHTKVMTILGRIA